MIPRGACGPVRQGKAGRRAGQAARVRRGREAQRGESGSCRDGLFRRACCRHASVGGPACAGGHAACRERPHRQGQLPGGKLQIAFYRLWHAAPPERQAIREEAKGAWTVLERRAGRQNLLLAAYLAVKGAWTVLERRAKPRGIVNRPGRLVKRAGPDPRSFGLVVGYAGAAIFRRFRHAAIRRLLTCRTRPPRTLLWRAGSLAGSARKIYNT